MKKILYKSIGLTVIVCVSTLWCQVVYAQLEETSILVPVIDLVLSEEGDPSINGTINLPSGITANSGGATFEINTFPIIFYNDGPFLKTTTTTVTIPSGMSSIDYSIPFPPDPGSDEVKIEFECESGCDSLDVTTNGFWSETSGVVSSLSGTNYSTSRANNVDIDLENGDFFVGQINFPSTYMATSGEQIVIRIREDAIFSFTSFPFFIYPESDETSWPFSFSVPTGTGNWKLEVSCNSCDININDSDHFPTSTTGDPLTLDENNAVLFPKGADHQNLSLTFFEVL